MSARFNCRFSGGVASAIATKLILASHPRENVVITCSDMGGEDDDRLRFRVECERWFGHPIDVRRNERYVDHIDVWEKERFIKGLGAPRAGSA